MDHEMKRLIIEMADLYLREADGNPQEAARKFEEYLVFARKWVSAAIQVLAK